MLSPDEAARYARHLSLPEVGEAGQRRLKAARVVLVGAGGLGSPAALYLAAAGVGTLVLADDDAVDLSNLQRQVLYGQGDVGLPKTLAAEARLKDLNPFVTAERRALRVDAANADALLRGADAVVDGSDNFPTRYAVNDAAARAGVPVVYGSVQGFEGQVSVFWAAKGPCYRCLHPAPPPEGLVPSCGEGGVLGVLPGVIGTLQAAEALKLLLGVGEPLVGAVLHYDALAGSFRRLRLAKAPGCPGCAGAAASPAPAACAAPAAVPSVSAEEAAARRAAGARVLDVREPGEVAAGRIAGSIHIPLGELEARLGELDPSAELLVHCRSGGRSSRAVALLRARGFSRAVNMAGGLKAWAERVDPSVPVA